MNGALIKVFVIAKFFWQFELRAYRLWSVVHILTPLQSTFLIPVERGCPVRDALFAWLRFGAAPFVEQLRGNKSLAGAPAAITAAVAGVVLNLFVWFALYVLFGRVIETHWGLLRWYAFDPLALDVRAAALATIAALLPADCIAG